ncbi:hypothetical protein XO10_03045 [Marinitoga sp. 1135]|uniref:Uncharacterized protein n=1 Tax=Marinitoga piezophila (strain DSM 14283 / JCM 11233 / KA3) TaxID=443254 RepID=H2J5Q3_MARPK|nr:MULTISPECIES: DUF3919 family protein [Marinitoga]AEX85039.1 hypothetical protein Marpi_0599 [Marinitoga piezophila KA3]APT75549.1 hypothetical protein LN42_03435 [Marinitoga sp. 1137]NUU95260.1 hypothetical protein [Marinitoga sp. 1135]NUU97194.1 hypothetical protein [Marinitoga sp. 1138]
MNKTIKKYIIIFLFITIFIGFWGVISLNRVFDKVYFINDSNEVLKKYMSSTPIKITFKIDYLPQCEITEPEIILNVWRRISELPVYKYIESSNNPNLTIIGSIFFLDGSKKDFLVNKDLKIGKYIYGSDEDIEFFKEILKEKLFNISNISKLLFDNRAKIIFFDKLNGALINDEKLIMEIYNTINTSLQIYSSEKIGKILQNKKNSIYKVKVIFDNIDVITFEIFDAETFAVYYMDKFLYLRKGNILKVLEFGSKE